MKKLFYETPSCEAFEMSFESALLVTSPGSAGEELNPLTPIEFSSTPFDSLF